MLFMRLRLARTGGELWEVVMGASQSVGLQNKDAKSRERGGGEGSICRRVASSVDSMFNTLPA